MPWRTLTNIKHFLRKVSPPGCLRDAVEALSQVTISAPMMLATSTEHLADYMNFVGTASDKERERATEMVNTMEDISRCKGDLS